MTWRRALLGLAGLPFLAGGLYFGVWGLVDQVSGWVAARDWVPVEARVLEAGLESIRGRDATTYRAHARYRYEFQGRLFVSTRVGLYTGADNIGSWQQEIHARAETARAGGGSITAYVDPRAPERAVLDRSLRWPLALVRVPFAVLFTGGGLLLLHLALRGARADAAGNAAAVAGNTEAIAADGRLGAKGLWTMAIAWNVLAWPAAALALVNASAPAAWLALLFPAAGLFLVHLARRAGREARGLAAARLILDPRDARLGVPLALRIEGLAGVTTGTRALVALVCEQVDTRGEDTTRTTVWRAERLVRADGAALEARFLVPAGAQPSGSRGAPVYHQWRVETIYGRDRAYGEFPVVVGALRGARDARAAPAADDSADLDWRAAIATDHADLDWLLGEQVRLRPIGPLGDGGVEVELLPQRHRDAALVLGLAGAVFALLPLALLVVPGGGMPGWLTLLLVAVGAPMLLHAARLATSHVALRAAGGILAIEETGFLRRRSERVIGARIAAIVPSLGYRTSSGTRTTESVRLVAELTDGASVRFADGIGSRAAAAGLAHAIARSLELAPGRVAGFRDGRSLRR